jgi:two-component system NarL family sensor kinase
MPASRSAFWLTLIGALFAISFGAAFVLRHLQMASDGARLEPGGNALTLAGVVVTSLRPIPGGLQTGDIVLAVNGRSLESWSQNLFGGRYVPPAWTVGETLQYRVMRGGQPSEIQVRLDRYPLIAIIRSNWGTIAFALASLLVATFVFLRRPDHPAGRVLFLGAAFLTSSTAWSFGMQVSDFMDGVGFWLFKIATLFFYNLYWTANFHFALIFPQPAGILRRRRWFLPLIYILPFLLAGIYLLLVRQYSSGILDWFRLWTVVEGAHASVFLSLTLGGLVWQYRRNPARITRQQLRWVILAGFISGSAGLLFYILPGALGLRAVGPNVVGLIVLPYPIAIAIAILRYNLFDIDTLLNRTLVYGALTVGTMAIYVLIVGYLGDLLQVRERTVIAFLTTGLVAVIFQPLREWLQRLVNRWMYGERDDPYAVLSRLGRRLESTFEQDAIFPTIVETIAQALKLPYVAIALEQEGSYEIAASYGLPPGSVRSFPAESSMEDGWSEVLPLAYQNEPVGRLILSQRAPDEPFTEAERNLIGDLARQVEVAVHNFRLTADLRRSYQRLVSAREEERHRIRRDLHDGLGPQLASLTLKLDAARNLLQTDPEAAERMLVDLKKNTQSAVADIRRLVYGLRPPALDELGLVDALRRQAAAGSSETGLKISIDAPEPFHDLPAAVESALYRIAVEAMTNVIRHSQASWCTINLEIGRNAEMEIHDDGIGLPAEFQAGVGLASMRERAEELGGKCVIEKAVGGGTLVRVKIPLE